MPFSFFEKSSKHSLNPLKEKERKKMNFNKKKYCALMIFLLLWFVVPITTMYGQSGYMTIDEIEGESVTGWQAPYLATEGDPDYPEGFDQNTFTTLPASRFELGLSESMAKKRNKFSVTEEQNFIKLMMNGSNNKIAATQDGKNNIMNLGVVGNSNSATYKQFGSNNYIKDRIVGDNKHREVVQEGDKLGIYNQGMQTIPMIIKQRGQGMKIRITGSPPGK